jgi:2-phospho-L-lactate/phosphoenolpyruvate guanylyltransferase
VPFKGLAAPKRRLAPLLDLTERRGLARAMLADVLAALRAAEGFGRVVLVSRDPAALELAAHWGADALPERGRAGYRAAAEQAAAAAKAAGAAGLLLLPADLPLLTAADLERLLAESERAAVVLTPSRGGRGTNAVLARPPGVLPYCYGPASFRAHLREAVRAGLPWIVLELSNLALDIDRPADLRRLLADGRGGGGTATWQYLEEIRLAERLMPPRRQQREPCQTV